MSDSAYLQKRVSPFAQTPSKLLNSLDLSLKAKGLYGFMVSKPDGWNFTIRSMSKQLKEGVDAVRTALDELKKYGWIDYRKFSDGSGVYTLNWEAFEHLNRIQKPNTENPNKGNSNEGKSQPISKKDCISKKDINKNNTAESGAKNSQPTFPKPTLQQVRDYALDRGRQDLAKRFFDFYDVADWKDTNGKQVKNWKQKFITWEGTNPSPRHYGRVGHACQQSSSVGRNETESQRKFRQHRESNRPG